MKNTFVTASSENQANRITQEVSLVDILRFIKNAWKTVTIFGLLGLTLSITYLAITPKQYEATAQITMAQIGIANNSINPLVVNIEEPALLIARLTSPTSFTPEVIAACGLENQTNAGLALSKSIKLMIPKGVANVVAIRIFGPTPQVAQECSQALFELIKITQSQIIAPYIEEAKVKLLDDEVRLQKAKDIMAKSDKSASAMVAAYLSTRDEIRYLSEEITALKNVVTANQNRATRLLAPIYLNDMPISPKKQIALAAGLFGGLCLGLLIALARQMIAKLKAAMRGAV